VRVIAREARLPDPRRRPAAGGRHRGHWQGLGARIEFEVRVDATTDDAWEHVRSYRCDCSDDLATLVAMGPNFMERVGFAMDRRMLLGVKERAEAAVRLRAHPGHATGSRLGDLP